MENSNPLQKYFRQPKLYIKLPSSGNFYPPGSIEPSSTGEYPVYAMTAKDEIVLKTPDALLNGQSTVEVIQSCMPNIKNAWDVPSLDIDAILIAIRIATYGENLDLEVKLPNTDIAKEFTADLRLSLGSLLEAVFDSTVKLNDELSVELRPLNYKQYTENSIKAIEEQKLFSTVNNSNISEEEKVKSFTESFKKLTDLTVGSVIQSIEKIRTPDAVVTDRTHIADFINNADKEFYNKIVSHLEKQRENFQLQPFKIQTSKEDQEAGAPAEFSAPITLDASNFFA